MIKQWKISEININFDFKYRGVIWQKKGHFWTNIHQKKFLGLQDNKNLVSLVRCVPFLAGKYQPEMSQWFNDQTIVEKVEITKPINVI